MINKSAIPFIIIFILLLGLLYIAIIRPGKMAYQLSNNGTVTYARVIGSSSDPTPNESYCFNINEKQYYGGFYLDYKEFVPNGDSVEILYLSHDPDVNMVPEGVEHRKKSFWYRIFYK